MSLKARIEAVIYAAEEPVTLAQLTALFREEALASRAARLAPQADASAPFDTSSTDAVVEELLPSSAETVSSGDSSPVAPIPATESLETEAPPVPSSHKEPPPTTVEALNTTPALEREAPLADERAGLERAVQREVRDEIRRLINELIEDYSSEDHGLEIREVAGGFRFATRPEVHDAVRGFIKSLKPPMRLSLQALETLAVIAYKQPVTAPEIGEIRGVDTAGVLGSLIARKLITTAGRKPVIGRPILYKTTKEFLLRFGLRDLNELPSIEEFEKMASEFEEENAPPEAEGDSPSAQDLPFAQNELAALEEDAQPADEISAESSSKEAPTSEPDAALEEHSS